MRYYFDTSTLFIRGNFRAVSTGIAGGIRSVSTIINQTVPAGWSHEDPEKELEFIAAGSGIDRAFFGLLTAVPVQQCCILQYDYVTVFITAGVRREPPANAGTINIIVFSNEGMEDAALLETIMVATEAKAEALLAMGLPLTGTPTDAVIVGCEGGGTTPVCRATHGYWQAYSRSSTSRYTGSHQTPRRSRSVQPFLIFHLQPFQW